MLSAEVKEQLKLAQSEGTFLVSQNDTELKEIMKSLDVLFVFERKRSFQEKYESNFQESIHNWISLLAGCIFRTGNILLNRRALLHILRTNGISKWGTALINFPQPRTFSEVFVDNYLISLKAFLGPIEELEELLGPKRLEEIHEKQSIKSNEGGKWIVVDEGIFKPSFSSVPNSIILTEEDYIGLLRQFDVISKFQYFVSFYFLESVSLTDPFTSIAVGNLIMKGFSIAHQILGSLSKTLSLFPSSFLKFRQFIASLIILINESFQESLQLLSMEHFNSPLIFSLPDNGATYTNLQFEIDSYLFRSAKSLLSKYSHGLECYVVNLPFEKISKAASVKFMEELLSGNLFSEGSMSAPEVADDSSLATVILRDNDPSYLFQLLQKLIMNGADMGKMIGNKIVLTCFEICLSNADFQAKLLPHVRLTLAALCSFSHYLIGLIIQKSLEKFTAMESIIIDFFELLPLEKWIPQPVDIMLIENMLKDPIGSIKSTLACRIADAIMWENHCDISYETQKNLAFALVNIHLDLLGRNAPTGIIQETKSAIAKSAKILAGGIGFVDTRDCFEEFNYWIWLAFFLSNPF